MKPTRSAYNRLAAEHTAAMAKAGETLHAMMAIGKELAQTDRDHCRRCGLLYERTSVADDGNGGKKERRHCRCGQRWWTPVEVKP